LSKNTYRFLPMTLSPDEVGGIHGTNERIDLEGYRKMVRWYTTLVQLWGEGEFHERVGEK